MFKAISRSLLTPLILAGLYLIPVNLFLNLPAAQVWLNSLQPDALALTWERAWSWYPLRVEIRGLAADGQTAVEQWQVDAGSAGASVSLVPLLRGQIRIHDLDLNDVQVHLRPRPKSRQDDPALRPFYPVIRHRDPTAVAAAPPPAGGPLVLAVKNLRLTGETQAWIGHIRATLTGTLGGSFSLDTGTGQVGLANADLDLRLPALAIGPDQDLLRDAAVRGRIEVQPFVMTALNGLDALRLLMINAEIDLPAERLHALNHLLHLDGLTLDGSGRLHGRLHLEHGDLRGDTDLVLDADRLHTGIGRFGFAGHGTVELRVDPQDEQDLVVRFATVEVQLAEDGAGSRSDRKPATLAPVAVQPLYRGRDVSLTLHLAAPDRKQDVTRLIMAIPEFTVPDLSVYQRFLPPQAGLAFHGGQGRLSGRAEVSRDTLLLDLALTAAGADLAYHEQRLSANLDLRLRIAGQPQAGESRAPNHRTKRRAKPTVVLDLSGTRLSLDDARLILPDQAEPRPWQAALTIAEGHFQLPLTGAELAHGAMLSLAERSAHHGVAAVLLEMDDARLRARFDAPQLNWIAALIHHPMGLALRGSGAVDVDLRMTDGLLGADSALAVKTQDLGIDLLDHAATGAGEVKLKVEQGGRHPLLALDARLADARLGPADAQRPELEQARFELAVRARNPDAHGRGAITTIDLRVPTARVKDMSVYNPYLPPQSPLRFVAGEAEVSADLSLAPNQVKGQAILNGQRLRMQVAGEDITTDLRLDVLVRDGDVGKRRFNIAGSALRLHRVQVTGNAQTHQQPDWHALVQTERAQVQWSRPLTLDLAADIMVADSRPFVAVLDQQRGKHDWIGELLTVKDLAGRVELAIDQAGTRVPHLLLGSREIEIGAKGRATAAGPEGVVYARFHNLAGLLAQQGETRHFDLTDARRR
ncbi:hypothetical protein, partial [uncultured Lamprocystis sp.]|uniref:hypothetical protein n=1 Tax=uncultured Lamprocystis sp. TaxID=543132 RepID=UPI0025CEF177